MITFQQERFADFKDDMAKLVDAHWAEVTGSGPPLDMAWDTFCALDAAGMMRVLAVRDDGELIGYITFVLFPMLHYKTVIAAQDDAFYLKPEYRKGRLGIQLFIEAEKMLRATSNVGRITIHEKLKRPMGKILARLGFVARETIWFKDLIEWAQ